MTAVIWGVCMCVCALLCACAPHNYTNTRLKERHEPRGREEGERARDVSICRPARKSARERFDPHSHRERRSAHVSQSWDREDAVERNGHLPHDPVHIQAQSWEKQQATSHFFLKVRAKHKPRPLGPARNVSQQQPVRKPPGGPASFCPDVQGASDRERTAGGSQTRTWAQATKAMTARSIFVAPRHRPP